MTAALKTACPHPDHAPHLPLWCQRCQCWISSELRAAARLARCENRNKPHDFATPTDSVAKINT